MIYHSLNFYFFKNIWEWIRFQICSLLGWQNCMHMTSVVNPFGGIATHAAFQLMTKNCYHPYLRYYNSRKKTVISIFGVTGNVKNPLIVILSIYLSSCCMSFCLLVVTLPLVWLNIDTQNEYLQKACQFPRLIELHCLSIINILWWLYYSLLHKLSRCTRYT